MEHISSHTLNEDIKILGGFYKKILLKVKAGMHYTSFVPSLEQYYAIVKDALEYFTYNGDYESCEILNKNFESYLNMIPKNVNEAVKYLVESVKHENLKKIPKIDTYSLAINLHQSTGFLIMDMWLLRHDISPLRQHCVEKYKTENTDEITNKILTVYIDALKSYIELEQN